ncbi:MAG TPA: SPFH domain-containing protein [Candidatus Acidoferrum sp.]|jgi:regulator of protease activity HflC (stomatin/prohibitin superfamily)|nr:SPFH domain-containing protein [Candidatus Acidoferrum sp.]
MGFTLLCFVFIFGVVVLRIYAGWLVSATLVEYQRGVLFRRGFPVRDVGPGRYRVWTGFEKIMILDTRPVQVNYENQSVSLRDGAVAVYSFSGSARVKDARKALYAAANYSHVPAFVLLCCARLVLNESTSPQMHADKDAVTERIITRAQPRLVGAGFELLSFRLTDVSVGQQRVL